MTGVAGVFEGLPLTSPGIDVLDGKKLVLSDVLGRTDYHLWCLERHLADALIQYFFRTGPPWESNPVAENAMLYQLSYTELQSRIH